MMIYTFYLNGDFYPIMSTTYEGACRVFGREHDLDAAVVTSVKAAA